MRIKNYADVEVGVLAECDYDDQIIPSEDE